MSEGSRVHAWLSTIDLPEYYSVFVEEGYEQLDDLVELAEAGKDGLDEMVQQCNTAVPGGKLAKLKHKNRLRIALARLVEVDGPSPASCVPSAPAPVRTTTTSAPAAAPAPPAAENDRLSNALSRLLDGTPSSGVTTHHTPQQGALAQASAPDSAEEFEHLDFLLASFTLTETERTSIRRRKSKATTGGQEKEAGPKPTPPPPYSPVATSTGESSNSRKPSPGAARKRALPAPPPPTSTTPKHRTIAQDTVTRPLRDHTAVDKGSEKGGGAVTEIFGAPRGGGQPGGRGGGGGNGGSGGDGGRGGGRGGCDDDDDYIVVNARAIAERTERRGTPTNVEPARVTPPPPALGGAPSLPAKQPVVSTSATGGSSWVVAPKKKGVKKGTSRAVETKSFEEMKRDLLRSKEVLNGVEVKSTKPQLQRGQTIHR